MVTYSANTTALSPVKSSQRLHPGALLVLLTGIVSLLSCGVLYWQNQDFTNKAEVVQQGIDLKKQELKNLQPIADELDYYDQVAKYLHRVFDTRINWEISLGKIEQKLYKKMAVTNIQLTEKGNFSLSGYTPNYTEYAKIYASLTSSAAKDYFRTVRPVSLNKVSTKEKVNGQEVTTEKIAFSFNIALTNSVLHPQGF